MRLEHAIKHYTYNPSPINDQLAAWLKELKRLRDDERARDAKRTKLISDEITRCIESIFSPEEKRELLKLRRACVLILSSVSLTHFIKNKKYREAINMIKEAMK